MKLSFASPQLIGRLPYLTEIMLVLLLAWLVSGWLVGGASSGASGRASLTAPGMPSLDVDRMVSTALFGQAETESKPTVAESQLNIHLHGTVVAGDQSVAILSVPPDTRQQVFELGDEIQPGVELTKVLPLAIIVSHHGKLERIDLPKASIGGDTSAADNVATAAADDSSVDVNRAELNQQLQNLPKLLSQARVTPYMSGGKMEGYKLSSVVKGSLFAKIGLADGDIIRSVNGKAVGDAAQAIQMLQAMQHNSDISVEIERAGQVRQIQYHIR